LLDAAAFGVVSRYTMLYAAILIDHSTMWLELELEREF